MSGGECVCTQGPHVCLWKVKNHVFSALEDFYKGTHEAKMIGMHIGSVLSGLESGNVSNDHKMPN